MKREADGDMGSPQKRTRRGDEEVRLLIPSKVSKPFFTTYFGKIFVLNILEVEEDEEKLVVKFEKRSRTIVRDFSNTKYVFRLH